MSGAVDQTPEPPIGPSWFEPVPLSDAGRVSARIAAGALAVATGAWGVGFCVSPHGSFWLSSMFFVVGLTLGRWRWRAFLDTLLVAAPLFVVVPNHLGLANYSLAELLLLGGICGAATRVLTRPPSTFPRCHLPLTQPVLAFAALALVGWFALLATHGGVFNGFFARWFAWQTVHSVQLSQTFVFNTFGATYGIVQAAILFFWVARRVCEPGGGRAVTRALALSCAGLGGAFVVAWALGFDSGSFHSNEAGHLRVAGFLHDPNSFATALTITLGPAIGWSLTRRAWWERALWFPWLSILALVVTHSHIAWLGVILGTAWFGLAAWRDLAGPTIALHLRRKAIAAAVIVGFGLAWGAVVFGLGDEPDSHPTIEWMREDHSVARALRGRLPIWASTLTLIHERPIWGLHPGMLYPTMYYQRLGNPDGVWYRAENAHNQLLQFWAELGAPGALLALLLTAMGAYRVFKSTCVARGPDRALSIAIGAGWWAALTTTLTGHPFVIKELLWMFAALTALLYIPRPGDDAARRAAVFQKRDPWLIVWAVVAALAVAAAARSNPNVYQLNFYGVDADFGAAESAMAGRAEARVHNAHNRLRLVVDPQFASAAEPLTLTVWIEGRPQGFYFDAPGWRTLDFYLPEEWNGRAIQVALDCDRYWRPAAIIPEASDRRPRSLRILNFSANLTGAPEWLDTSEPPGARVTVDWR